MHRDPTVPEGSPKNQKVVNVKNQIFANSYKHDENYQRQQLNDYEQAFRKLK